MNRFHNNAIFWVAVDKISPNPYQPRKEFDEEKLQALADSVRQYGVLQPLVVTRTEVYSDDGSMRTEYELIAGERRLRASRLAGISQVPVVIRDDEEGDNVKLELAIIENLQREDLNPVDRANAFAKLVEEFGYKHTEVAHKVGKSREYVSNTLRLLQLSEEMLEALASRRISEGHTRPLLMLSDHSDEQSTLFKEILFRGLTVRDAETIARQIAKERVRKGYGSRDPHIAELEEEASETLGRKVRIAPRKVGGRMVIDFDSDDDLKNLLEKLRQRESSASAETEPVADRTSVVQDMSDSEEGEATTAKADEPELDDDYYAISHFSI